MATDRRPACTAVTLFHSLRSEKCGSVAVSARGALCAIPIFTKTEGETFFFGCAFASPAGSRFFTKKESNKENVLIETSDVNTQRGRYGIKYDTDVDVLYVSISQLNKADSGQYRCGLGNSSISNSHREFEVRVTDAMCDGNTTLTNPGITVCTEPEGGSIRVRCDFSSAGLFSLFFCKDGCKKQDVLIETDGFKSQRGRYRIEYERNGVFYVTIANLTKSDSGVYRCGVDVPSSPNPCLAVEIIVTDVILFTAPTTSEPSSTLLPTHSLISSSGSCTPSTAFPPITTLSSGTASNAAPLILERRGDTGYMIPLVVCLTVVVLLVVILLALYKKKRKRDSQGPNARESSRSENIECATY